MLKHTPDQLVLIDFFTFSTNLLLYAMCKDAAELSPPTAHLNNILITTTQ